MLPFMGEEHFPQNFSILSFTPDKFAGTVIVKIMFDSVNYLCVNNFFCVKAFLPSHPEKLLSFLIAEPEQKTKLDELQTCRHTLAVQELIAVASLNIQLADNICVRKILFCNIFIDENMYIRIFAFKDKIFIKTFVLPEPSLQIYRIYSDPLPLFSCRFDRNILYFHVCYYNFHSGIIHTGYLFLSQNECEPVKSAAGTSKTVNVSIPCRT